MRKLLVFTLGMAMAAATWAQPRPAVVDYSFLGRFDSGATRERDELLVPSTLLERLGWSVRFVEGEADIAAEGRRIRLTARGETVPLREALQQLGASSRWVGDALRVLGVVRVVEVGARELRIDATIGVRPNVFRLQDPERLVVDLQGAELPATPLQLPIGVRVGQFAEDVVRVVLERPGIAAAKVGEAGPGRSIRIGLDGVSLVEAPGKTFDVPTITPLDPPPPEEEGDAREADPASEAPPLPPISLTPPPADPLPPAPSSAAVAVAGVPVVASGARDASVRIPLDGRASLSPTTNYRAPDVVEIAFPNTLLPTASIPAPSQGFVRRLEWEPARRGPLRLVVYLSRPLAFEFGLSGGAAILRLVRPTVADGRLAGKTVVVDAGHGAEDSGAVAPDRSANEKSLTILVARRLASALTAAGASVILTRADDTRIPLKERAEIANRAGAAIFVSIHFNSNRTANSRSGSMSFYHRQDPDGRLLAECIQRELAKASRIPSLGIYSDTRIYQSGFAVLRYSKMPAVLLELGFLNHRTDRSIITSPEFHQSAAEAIVRGVRVFLGDEQE